MAADSFFLLRVISLYKKLSINIIMFVSTIYLLIGLSLAGCESNILFNADARTLKVLKKNGDLALNGILGKFISPDSIRLPCSSLKGDCYSWSDGSTLSVQSLQQSQNGAACQLISWNASSCQTELFEDCYDMKSAHWYGGAQIKGQLWPIEKLNRQMAPYVPGDSYQDRYGGVQERYFFNSNGSSIFVDFNVPLWVSINASGDGLLCLRATYKNSPYNNIYNRNVFLQYKICQGNNAFDIYQQAVGTYFAKPTAIPDENLFRYPIWSTWVRYGSRIDQNKVLQFAQEIVQYGFPHAQIEIDDNWESYYGSLDFNLNKFPEPKAMVDTLTSMGFRTTIWVHPFCDMYADGLRNGVQAKAYVTDPGRELPSLTSWWNGNAVILDATGLDAQVWYQQLLTNLRQNYGISSFKFDAGEVDFLPAAYFLQNMTENPGAYSAAYAMMAFDADRTVRNLEVRVGVRTQHLPVFLRMMDKDSRWDYQNGLRTLIPHVLFYGIIGYPFALPDMIGGNAYALRPTKELFIRWLGVNVFLPSIQFSITPWDYDNETVNIARDMLALRERYAEQLINLGQQATIDGSPIIRPLWWIAPEDDIAQSIDTEFLVGDNILVAPVLDENAVSRDIYLPFGNWHDELRGDNKTAGWYYNYQAALHEIPHFVRIE